MKYSVRILKAVDLMEPGYCLADIGCDHGYMSILAAEKGLYQKIYACDISAGPLSRASNNIRQSARNDCITTILSDGLRDVPEDAESAVICGMGGLLIRRILSDSEDRLPKFRQFILGPHSEIEEVRRFLLTRTDFMIYRETAVLDGGKHYILMDVRPGSLSSAGSLYHSETDLRLGIIGNQTDPEAYMEYLSFLLRKTQKALSLCEKGTDNRAGERSEVLQRLFYETAEHIRIIRETY